MSSTEPAAVLHLSIAVDDLVAARTFYESTLGCRVGRVRPEWIDVWFFGMQVTLHLAPDQTHPATEQGHRHFGVVLTDRHDFDALVARVDAAAWPWIARPALHDDAALSGKLGGKLADPSGNVIEIKHYADIADLLE